MTNEQFLQSCYKVKALAEHGTSFSHVLPKQEFEQHFNNNKETLVSLMPELFVPIMQSKLWESLMLLYSLEDAYRSTRREKNINQNKETPRLRVV